MVNGVRKKYNSNIFGNKGPAKKESKTEGRRRFTTMHPSLLNPSVIDQSDIQQIILEENEQSDRKSQADYESWIDNHFKQLDLDQD